MNLNDYKMGRDYRIATLQQFSDYIPDEITTEFEIALNSLVSEMVNEQNRAIKALVDYKHTQEIIGDYENHV